MKKRIISLIFLFMILLYGCGDKNFTHIVFESYNELEDFEYEYHSRDKYNFEVNQQRYKIMHGSLAEQITIIRKDENNKDKLILMGTNNKILSTIMTEIEYTTFKHLGKTIKREYGTESIRECTDIDGKIYILYSKYDTDIGNLFLEELKSTHILEMDMDNYTVTKQYDFGESVAVITIHDGFVYTMEDGRVYRELLGQTGSKECMADLGFRGMPDVEQFAGLTFRTEADGIKIIAEVKDEEKGYGYKSYELVHVKYTDSPIESE